MSVTDYPNLFLPGAMKSATSTFHERLTTIPDIAGADRKEVYFFSSNARYSQGPDAYLARFAAAPPCRYWLDSSQSYLVDSRVPSRIARFLDRRPAKFIFCLREPVARCISALTYCTHLLNVERRAIEEVFRPALEATELDAACDAEMAALAPARAAGRILPSNGESDHLIHPYAYVTSSHYARFLQVWLDTFPRESFFFCTFEEVTAGTPDFVARLETFLGVTGLSAPFARRDAALQTRIYKHHALARMADTLRPLMCKLPHSWRASVRQRVAHTLKRSPDMGIRPDVRDRLQTLFARELATVERGRLT